MVHGREGFVIGDLVRVRHQPSQLYPTGSPGVSRTFRVTSGPDHQGCYTLIASSDDFPKFVTIHGERLITTAADKYHSVGRAIDTPWVDPVAELERAAWAEVGMGPDEIKAALFDNAVTNEED